MKTLQKEQKNARLLTLFLDKEVENLEDHSSREAQDVVDEKFWICLSYPFKQKTTIHCVERKAKLFGKWIMRQLML